MSSSEDRTLRHYDKNSRRLATRYESAAVDDIHRALTSCFERGLRLLELGTGSGRDASYLMTRGYDVVGIDGSDSMIEEAYSLHPELTGRLRQGCLPEVLGSVDGPFGGLYSIAALMHLRPSLLPDLFTRVSDLLSPGGRFFFSVSLLRDDIDESGHDEKGRYFNSLSREEWLKHAGDGGFKVLETWINEDGLDRKGLLWLTAIVEKL